VDECKPLPAAAADDDARTQGRMGSICVHLTFRQPFHFIPLSYPTQYFKDTEMPAEKRASCLRIFTDVIYCRLGICTHS